MPTNPIESKTALCAQGPCFCSVDGEALGILTESTRLTHGQPIILNEVEETKKWPLNKSDTI
jgi:hypothetical protein